MARERPLPTLLAQVLVAYTIEFDNEFERHAPHRLTIAKSEAGGREGPWLVSRVMWANVLRHVEAGGTTVREFAMRANLNKEGMRFALVRMSRWGFLKLSPRTADGGPGTRIIRPTAAGKLAQQIWRSLPETIDRRWIERFGAQTIDDLRETLRSIVAALEQDLPESVPILGYGLRADVAPPRASRGAGSGESIGALLSKAFLAFTLEFEAESTFSLALNLGVVRVLSDEGLRLRDLPALTGLAKEGVAFCTGFLQRHGYAVYGHDGAKAKLIKLTAEGLHAQRADRKLLANVEDRWKARYGDAVIGSLRATLIDLLDRRAPGGPVIAQGLEPPPGAWRLRDPYAKQTAARLRDPAAALPHCAMVLHRGGWPDGS